MGIFQNIPGNRVKRSAFDLSHERKFSCNMGELIPILCEEVVPGDTFRNNTESLVRLAPMLAPMMHRVNVYTHFFFVPNRLVWTEWENFITGGEDGTSLPSAPYYDLNQAAKNAVLLNGRLPDYLGVATLPTATHNSNTFRMNALPFRGYQLIWNEYYRDQNVQAKKAVAKGSGSSSIADGSMDLNKRSWEKDYFTSALPWTQRGGDVMMPGVVEWNQDATSYPILKTGAGTIAGTQQDLHAEASTGFLENTAGVNNIIDPNGTLQTGTLIEDLRRSTKLQQWLERNARGGSRYIEQILSHFGVKSSDARLQRPEYLGGGKSPIVISEVLQTSSTDATSPQANMSGHGVGVGNSHRFKKYFEEHGYVIGIMSILPRTAYVQGTRRHFYKSDKFDYYWPEFSQLGEQPVYDGELFETFNNADNKSTFGYQSRYSEYKFVPSTVHGDFKDTLDFWHMSRKFASAPALNSTFVTSDPTHRVFAVTDPAYDKLYVQVYNNLKAVRPMPYFNVPSL